MSFSFGVYSNPNTPVYVFAYSAANVAAGAYGNVSITEILDSNAAYNGTTFTCPSNSAGLYRIEFTLSYGDRVGGWYAAISKNGAAEAYPVYMYQDGVNEKNPLVCSCLVSLAVGDTIVPRAYAVGGVGSTTASLVIQRL